MHRTARASAPATGSAAARLRRVEHARGVARAPAANSARRARRPSSAGAVAVSLAPRRRLRRRAARCRPGSASSTGSWAAASSPARSRCSSGRPASASPRCCSRCWRRWPRTGVDVMLASAEESLTQVSGRAVADRRRCREHLLALEGHDVEAIEAAVEHHRPALVVVDSLQSVSDPELAQPAGSLAQVRACVERLTRLAKSTGVPLAPGRPRDQGRRPGRPAGRRAPGRHRPLLRRRPPPRPARAHRRSSTASGPPGEVGIFEMRDDGLRAVPDPGPAAAGGPHGRRPGQRRRARSCRAAGRCWSRCRPCSARARRRRAARPQTLGIDAARANLLLAVLACRTAVEMPAPAEFFVAAVGGITVTEPAADLAVALAMASVVRRPAGAARRGRVRRARAWPARSARSRAPTAAWPRRTGPASPGRSCPRPRPARRGGTAGHGVHGVRTLAEALGRGPIGGRRRDAPGTMPGWSTVPAAASR